MSSIQKVVLVTGGAGFLGRHVCKRLLEQGRTFVICLDNLVTGKWSNVEEFINSPNYSPYFHFVHYDITVRIKMENILPGLFDHIDEIYHLACIASPDKYKEYAIETLMTSFQGTKNVLDLAKQFSRGDRSCKVLFTSTSEIYGDPLVHPQSEDYYGNVNTVGERSCYDEGKRVAETLIYEYRRKYGLDVKTVRLFNTYGPYMDIDDGRVITNFIKQIMANKPVHIYGDGSQSRSFCYVDDLMDGLFAMMASDEQGPINLGNPYCEFTLNQLVYVFEKVVGAHIPVHYLPGTENDPKQRKPDITKAYETLGFSPMIDLEDGLRRLIAYFRNERAQTK